MYTEYYGKEKTILGLFDVDERLNHNSWTIRGTHITNFSKENVLKYKYTIDEFKKIDPEIVLVISGFSYNNTGKAIDGYSLHRIGECRDLSVFWRIYERA